MHNTHHLAKLVYLELTPLVQINPHLYWIYEFGFVGMFESIIAYFFFEIDLY